MAAILLPTLSPPDVSAVEQEGLVLSGQAEDLTITDDDTYREAGAFLVSLKAYQKRVAEIFAPIVKAAHEAHKVAVAQREKLLGGANEAERIIKGALVTYERQQREAAEAQRREQEAIAQAQADQTRAATVAALEEAGQAQAAAAVRAAPPVPVVLPPTPPVPTLPGVNFRDHYSAEITDFPALVAAVAAGQQPLNLLLPNESALNALAGSLKESLRIPGVRVNKGRIPAANSR